ncbi:MAG: DM13 domain-containing protein [Mycobacteriales bacterium]
MGQSPQRSTSSVPNARRRNLVLAASVVGAALIGTGILYALRPQIITGALTNPRVWLLGAVVVAVSAALLLLTPALGAPTWLARSLAVIPLVAAAAWTVIPAFVNTTVNDQPVPVAQEQPAATSSSGSPGSVSPGSSAEAPVARAGALRGIDHRASGTARLIPVAGGGYVVRLENLDIEAGPDFLLYLVPGAYRRAPGDGVRLGKLKANRGNQNYPVPSGTTVTGTQTVLIWCRAFVVPIAAATPR